MNILTQFLLFVLPQYAVARIFFITSETPKIHVDNKIINFYEGGGSFLLLKNNIVRVNNRGIHTSATQTIRSSLHQKGWRSLECNISAYAMCNTVQGGVFVYSTPRVGYDRDWQETSCKNGGGKTNVNQNVYDISTCDITDESLDLVYTNQVLYYRQNQISSPIYWVLILGCVYLIRSISLNIVNRYNQDNTVYIQHWIVVVNLIIWVLILAEGDAFYIAEDDFVFFCLTNVYIVMYLVFHGYHVFRRYQISHDLFKNIVSIHDEYHHGNYNSPQIFNLSIACLQLVSMRLYGSTETPFVIMIIALLSCRIWEKHILRHSTLVLTGLIDCLYLSMLITWGFSYSVYYLFPLFMFTHAVAVSLVRPVKASV
jgi:hypothetical protein